jgi:hypothetical protein
MGLNPKFSREINKIQEKSITFKVYLIHNYNLSYENDLPFFPNKITYEARTLLGLSVSSV